MNFNEFRGIISLNLRRLCARCELFYTFRTREMIKEIESQVTNYGGINIEARLSECKWKYRRHLLVLWRFAFPIKFNNSLFNMSLAEPPLAILN